MESCASASLLVAVGERLLERGEGALRGVRLRLHGVQLGARELQLVVLLLQQVLEVLNLGKRDRGGQAVRQNAGIPFTIHLIFTFLCRTFTFLSLMST